MMRLFVALVLTASLHAANSLNLSSPELIAEGSALFAKSCAVGYCHGSEGRPARGPELRNRIWDPHELYRTTAEGLPGTSMPGWRNVIPDAAIWAVTAYVLSLSSDPPVGAAAIVELEASDRSAEPAPLSAEALRGKELYSDLTRQRRCAVCHQLDGVGTAIGPNLALTAGAKTKSELTRDILNPHANIAFGFEQVQLRLHSGERIDGVLAGESDSKVRIFDTASIPPPLRVVAKRDIQEQRTQQRSSMPNDLDAVYTAAEIAAIVAYLTERDH